MDLLSLPASPIKLYRQAKRLARSTSRANEAAWYRRPHEHDLQWHIWIGPDSGSSAVYRRSVRQWWSGPELPSISLSTDENGTVSLSTASRDALHDLLRQILSNQEFGKKPNSLGVLIHMADGLRIRDLAPDFAEEKDFDNLNELLLSAPEIAIGDDSISENSGKWRLLPLLGNAEGGKQALAAQITGKLDPVVDALRSYGEIRNIPVIVNVRSAPLEAAAGLPYIFPEIQSPEIGPSLALLHYESMTLLFATGQRGEISLLRPFLHRGTSHLSPEDIHEALFQTAALLNLKNPNIIFVSLVGLVESQLAELLIPYRTQFPQSRVRCINTRQTSLTEGVIDRCFEFAVAIQETPPSPNEQSFQKQFREIWAWQDFYGVSRTEIAKMPTYGDLRILKLSRIAQKVAMIAILGFAGWVGMDFIAKARSSAWRVSSSDAQAMELKLEKLQKEQREWKHWDRLLEKRSEGWLAMEALLELFPADGGVILSDAAYRAETNDTEKNSEANAIGLKRQWTINGFANPEVATDLSTLGSRVRITNALNSIAEKNRAPYLSVSSPTREVQVSFQQKQGTMSPSAEFPAKVARHFRTSFELTVTQSLSNKDELAINTSTLQSE